MHFRNAKKEEEGALKWKMDSVLLLLLTVLRRLLKVISASLGKEIGGGIKKVGKYEIGATIKKGQTVILYSNRLVRSFKGPHFKKNFRLCA